jgi:anaerobic selenocysteine-containing dehydrogenase
LVQTPTRETAKSQYQMTTARSEGQFNTVVYEQEDLYRNQTDRWVVMMNPGDMKKDHLQENDRVTVRNETGIMEQVTVQSIDIKSGNIVTYYPEANVLVPNAVDKRSKTPAFKSVSVTLTKE